RSLAFPEIVRYYQQGDESMETPSRERCLALQAAGQVREALSMALELLPKLELERGHYHPETVETLVMLGALERDLSRYGNALNAFIDAKQRVVTGLFDHHPLLISIFSELSKLYAAQDLLEEAVTFAQKSLEFSVARYGEY